MSAAVICSLRPASASASLLRQSKAMLALVSARHASTDRLRELEVKDDPAKILRDFKCNLTRHTSSTSAAEKVERLTGAISRERERPLVFVFGWAGATEKNMDKYSEIYRRAGCDTMAYFLPTRFIMSATSSVPHIARRLMVIADREGLLSRPIFFHDLSDTGLMVYQAVNKVCREDGVNLDVRGHIMDSCPGPRPKATLPRTIVFAIVNWISAKRDGMGLWDATKYTASIVHSHAWPNYSRYRKGLPSVLPSSMDGLWSGEYVAREEREARWPELFLYSKSDFYLPYQHLEKEVLARRKALGRDFRTVRWEKSSHVEHLRKHTKEYVGAVHNFLEEVYFSKLPSSDSAEEVFEAEVEEEDSREDAKRVAVAK